MIFERRAYTMEPGHTEMFDQAQIERGFDLVKPYMERLVGYFSTRSGVVDQVIHFYRYDDLADWELRLRGLYNVPELTPYFVNTRKIVRHQTNAFFEPLPVLGLNPLWSRQRDWLPADGQKLSQLSPNIIIEERAFQLKPGGIPAFVKACESTGAELFKTMEDRTIGAFMTMIGPLHNILIWWWFKTQDEQEDRLAMFSGRAEWKAFINEVSPFLLNQKRILMLPRQVPEMSPLFS